MKETGLKDIIGEPALLEQTAEECQELAFACLKLARLLRGENKVYGRTETELRESVEEEIADILVCYQELTEGGVIRDNKIAWWRAEKFRRMYRRIKELEV